MHIEIVKNEHGQFTYEVDGKRVHESWPTIQEARRAALKYRPKSKPVKESENADLPAV